MGITCEEVWRDISDYIDEELGPKQRAALDEHFASAVTAPRSSRGPATLFDSIAMNEYWRPRKGFAIDSKKESISNGSRDR